MAKGGWDRGSILELWDATYDEQINRHGRGREIAGQARTGFSKIHRYLIDNLY
jgi:hypothetical protein